MTHKRASRWILLGKLPGDAKVAIKPHQGPMASGSIGVLSLQLEGRGQIW